MTDSTSYIIVPPEDANGTINLQEIIEGLQTGRLVIGPDNSLVPAQQQQDSEAEIAQQTQQQQVVITLPEQAEQEDGDSTVVDNVQEPVQLQQLDAEVDGNTAARTFIVQGTPQPTTSQQINSGLPQETSLIEVSEHDLLNAVSADNITAAPVITSAAPTLEGTTVVQTPSGSETAQIVLDGSLTGQTIQIAPPQPTVVRKIIRRVVVPAGQHVQTGVPGQGNLVRTMLTSDKATVQTVEGIARQVVQTVIRPTQKIIQTPTKINQTGLITHLERSPMKTILVSPKEAARIVNMSGGPPVVTTKKAAMAAWQSSGPETDLLSTLSAAATSQYATDPEWLPEDDLGQGRSTISLTSKSSDQKKFSCHFCPKTFKFASSINRHLRTHTGEKPYKCKLCSFRCNREHNLKGHVLLKHCRNQAPLTCDKCNRCFVSPADLRKHLHSHSNYQYFKCGICGDRFLHSNTFRKHVATQHKGELFENPYMCAVCNIPFDTPGEVLTHVNSVHLQINLECRYCGIAFQRSDNLQRHEAEHEQREPPKRQRLSNFIEEAIQKAQIEQTLTGVVTEVLDDDGSLKNVKMVRKFECQFCGRLCFSRSKLKSHLSKQHTLEGHYTCTEPDCHRRFAYPYDLQDHMVRIHSKTELECYCGATFKSVGELKKHMKQKQDGKMFECRKCHALFSEGDMLNNHLMSDKHSADGKINQPYMCAKCDQVFNVLNDLCVHVTTHVGENLNERHGHPVLEERLPESGDMNDNLDNLILSCRIVEVPAEIDQPNTSKNKKKRRSAKSKPAAKPKIKKEGVKVEDDDDVNDDIGAVDDIDDEENTNQEPKEDFSVLTVTGADNETHELQVPNEFSGQIVVEKDGFKEIHIIKDGKAIQKYNVRVYPDGREVSVDDEFAVLGLDGQKTNTGVDDPATADLKSSLLIPLETGLPDGTEKTPGSLDPPPPGMDALAGMDPGAAPSTTAAVIPEAITQTVISSDVVGDGTGVAANYGQLLQAGLSHGGLQAAEIPQVVDALDSATIGLESDIAYQTLALAVPNKKKRAPPGSRNRLGNLKCRFCDKMWKFPSELRKHENTHIGNRPFSCSVCGKRFARKNNLKEHKTIHRVDVNPDELGKIVCPICGERCLYNSRLGRHIIVKHGNIDLTSLDPALQEVLRNISADGYTLFKTKCNLCGKMVGNMRRHMMTHEENRNFMCPHEGCGKAFKRLLHLKEHAATHLGEHRPKIACRKCNFTVFRKRDMEHHMVQAHGTKPKFTCPVCGKGFGESYRHKLHMKSHLPYNERESFACDLCGRTFRHSVSVKQHIQKVHVELNM